jgi:hypothetical protein
MGFNDHGNSFGYKGLLHHKVFSIFALKIQELDYGF